jgi:hypothetical protein
VLLEVFLVRVSCLTILTLSRTNAEVLIHLPVKYIRDLLFLCFLTGTSRLFWITSFPHFTFDFSVLHWDWHGVLSYRGRTGSHLFDLMIPLINDLRFKNFISFIILPILLYSLWIMHWLCINCLHKILLFFSRRCEASSDLWVRIVQMWWHVARCVPWNQLRIAPIHWVIAAACRLVHLVTIVAHISVIK